MHAVIVKALYMTLVKNGEGKFISLLEVIPEYGILHNAGVPPRLGRFAMSACGIGGEHGLGIFGKPNLSICVDLNRLHETKFTQQGELLHTIRKTGLKKVERETGLEPATCSLGSCRSTNCATPACYPTVKLKFSAKSDNCTAIAGRRSGIQTD